MKPDCSLPFFSPSHSCRMWADQNAIYAEVPATSPSLPPLILSFAKNEGGLSKALALLATRETERDPSSVNLTQFPATKNKAKIDPERREAARAKLRALGLLT